MTATLNALFARSCWTFAILYLSCIIITPASTQSFSYPDKQYFLVKEGKTLDDAAASCRNRGQRLVQIRSEAENDFIYNSIVKSASGTHTWIGATNTVGTKSFKWLDGSEMIYSKWYPGQPDENINQHNGVYMHSSHTDGKWVDSTASNTFYFICETPSIFALHSKLVNQADQLNATIEQLDSKLSSVFDNGTSLLRSEYIKLNAINALAVAEVEASLKSVNESLQTVIANNVATEEKLVELIKGQVVEYSYMDKQYVLIREYNTFYSAVRSCKNRNETLVSIGSQIENEFIFNSIVKPSGHVTWLGATNEIGYDTYKWLDGNDLTYSNWDTGFPDKDSDGRNGILMNQSSGQWFDQLATGIGFVICERPTLFALQSTVLEQQLILSEQAATIRRLEQNLEQSQIDVNRLERQANETKIENEIRFARIERKLIKG